MKNKLNILIYLMFMFTQEFTLSSELEENPLDTSIFVHDNQQKQYSNDEEIVLDIFYSDSINENQEDNHNDTTNVLLSIMSSEEDNEKIRDYIKKYLILEENIPVSPFRKKISFLLKGFSLLLGATAGIPYISPACKTVDENPFLCAAFGTGAIVAYGSAASWVFLKLVGHLDPISEEESYFYNKNKACSFIEHAVPNVLGIVTSLPDVYALYHYNTLKWLAIPGFVVSYMFKSQGYYELIERFPLLKNFFYADHNKTTHNNIMDSPGAIREKIILPLFMDDCNLMDMSEIKLNIINQLEVLLNKNSKEHIHLRALPFDEWEHKNKLKKAWQALGLIFPLGSLIVNGTLALSGLQLISSSPFFYYPATAVVMIPGLALDTVVTTITMGDIFDVIYNKITRNEKSDYIKSYHPILSNLIPFTAILFAILSGSADAVVACDIINNSSLSLFRIALPLIIFGSSTIFESYTGNDLAKRFIEQIDMCFGSSRQVEILKITSKLEIIESLLEISATREDKMDSNYQKGFSSISQIPEEDDLLTSNYSTTSKEWSIFSRCNLF